MSLAGSHTPTLPRVVYDPCMAVVTFTRKCSIREGVYSPGDTLDTDDARAQQLANIGLTEGLSDEPWPDRKNTPSRKAGVDRWRAYARTAQPGLDTSSMSKADLIEAFGAGIS